MLPDLRQSHHSYIERAKAAGMRVITYTAPCCGAQVETTAPKRRGEQWDTLTVCPNCGTQGLKVVKRDGVTVHLTEGHR